MKVLISADMEGVTGVTCPDDCEPGHARWQYHRTFLTSDVNAAVAGFAEAGATYEAIRCFRALTRLATSGVEKTYG